MSYYSFGVLYFESSDYIKATEYFEKAIELYERLEAGTPGQYNEDLQGCRQILAALKE